MDPDFCAVLSGAGLGEGALFILSDEAVFTMDVSSVFVRNTSKGYSEVDRRGPRNFVAAMGYENQRVSRGMLVFHKALLFVGWVRK